MALLSFNVVKSTQTTQISLQRYLRQETFLNSYDRAYHTRAKIPTIITSGHQQPENLPSSLEYTGVHKIIEKLRH
jgi:hypothetical protein